MEDEKNVGWGVCMKQFICGAWPTTTKKGVPEKKGKGVSFGKA